MTDPSPTIRERRCPIHCDEVANVAPDTLTCQRLVRYGDRIYGYTVCDEPLVEYVACPTSHAIRTWPNAHRLSIPAPEDHA